MILPNNTATGVLLQTVLLLANHKQNNNSLRELYNLPPNMSPGDIHDIRCYGVYGCFPLSPPWTVETRPVSFHPKSPEEIDVKFPVFNKNTKVVPKYFDINEPSDVKKIGIEPKGRIFLIAHGYIDTGNRPWVQEMVNTLIDNDDYGTASVIVIDWGLASVPPYTQAVANIRLIGAITAHVIHLIYQELKLTNLDKVHMIGHSLGAHLCGYAGYYLQKDFNLQLGRITGMDPAEPMFHGTEPIVRLDRTDAKFVDVIHSAARPFSTGGMGMTESIGHVDFFPNGGFFQPGCQEPISNHIMKEHGSFFWGVQNFVSCDHMRSYHFFTASVSAKCPFLSISCDSYEHFKAGLCFKCDKEEHYCISMGINAQKSYEYLRQTLKIRDSNAINTYLMTTDEKPWCRSHYKITISISSSEESSIHGGEIGIMSIMITSHANDETEKLPFSKEPTYYEPGFKYTSVIPGKSVGIPRYATLNWEYNSNPLNPLTWRILSSPRVYIDHIIVESMEHKSMIRLCPIFANPVIADTPNIFKQEYCHHNNHNKL